MKSEKINELDRRIGAALAFIRTRDCNQTQTVFARRFGISRSHLSKIESGIKPLSAKLGWIICRALDMNPTWLCTAGNGGLPNVFPLTDPAEVEKIEAHIFSKKNGLLREVWPPLAWLADDLEEKKWLTVSSLKSNITGVSSEIEKLIARVKAKAAKPGAKAELARTLDVDPARISEWLAGKKEPGGEYTLRLLKWVEQQERKK